ncbi:hypothetical protein M422DRAFT_258130 [Sphaerobolus stellatus SS14]|uniref:Uncharacterized protein n=1 Tax=Sphaerobolus stellatus (strain SS14) TaxID=990650 RepID=A0A0C9VCI1_SPHS4|nr:hypothetical protein M422DRAFT_258130 [Sphaerobolus stellatus SS14]
MTATHISKLGFVSRPILSDPGTLSIHLGRFRRPGQRWIGSDTREHCTQFTDAPHNHNDALRRLPTLLLALLIRSSWSSPVWRDILTHCRTSTSSTHLAQSAQPISPPSTQSTSAPPNPHKSQRSSYPQLDINRRC